jgi:hypothetical protein
MRGTGRPEPPGAAARDAAHARRLLWLAFWMMLASVGIGLPWDAAWHTSRRFETAFAPPHLFVYATTALTAALYVVLVTTHRLRRAFGPGFRVPGVAFPLPGPLFLVGAGLSLLALAAVLDVGWHTAFGLDETRWSTPHAMLSWGWGLASFGFIAARFALRHYRPLRWWTRTFVGLVLLAFSIGPLLGPFHHNQTAEKVTAIAAVPVLAEQASYQRTARIYLNWRLVRANPLFVVLGAVWVGMSLVLLRAVDHRLIYPIVLLGIWTVASLLRDRGTASRLGLDLAHISCWLPTPLLPAALAAVPLWRFGRVTLVAGAVSGAVFGLTSQLIWPAAGPLGGPLIGALLGVPFAVLGMMAGSRIARILEQPTSRPCATLAAVALAAPFASGAVDLYLRLRTP